MTRLDVDIEAREAVPELLGPTEPEPVARLDSEPNCPALLVCDHASNRIPARLDELGLGVDQLRTHIAVDIGAAALTRQLSDRLGLPAVLTNYSRLVVDCNRALADATAFPEVVDGVVIPGNRELDDINRRVRADALYWPYHHAVRDRLAALEELQPAPALIAIHSFTPVFDGQRRPWHFGILWDKDPRMPVELLKRLRALPEVHVGDNQPYSGRHPSDFTVDHHAEAEGLPHVSIEVRQDLLDSQGAIERWSAMLAECLAPILAEPGLYTNWSGGMPA